MGIKLESTGGGVINLEPAVTAVNSTLVLPENGTLATTTVTNAIQTQVDTHISVPTSYHIYNGGVTIDTTNVNINALVPYANGIDVNGSIVSISYKNQTISGLTLTQGKNYPYSKNDGTYGSKTIAPNYGITNPLTGDFFNLKTLKWYDNTNAEITPRTYLDCIVYADHNGQPTYVEELPKTTYFDEIKANDYKGKNACTAWVNFDGTTTPPTIRDSYNIASVVRTATGVFDIYFKIPMDNIKFSTSAMSGDDTAYYCKELGTRSVNKMSIINIRPGIAIVNDNNMSVQIFGGKL